MLRQINFKVALADFVDRVFGVPMAKGAWEPESRMWVTVDYEGEAYQAKEAEILTALEEVLEQKELPMPPGKVTLASVRAYPAQNILKIYLGVELDQEAKEAIRAAEEAE